MIQFLSPPFSTHDDIDDAHHTPLNSEQFKSGAMRFVSRAAIEMVVKERDGQDAERVEEPAQDTFRANVLKQSDCPVGTNDAAQFTESFLGRC